MASVLHLISILPSSSFPTGHFVSLVTGIGEDIPAGTESVVTTPVRTLGVYSDFYVRITTNPSTVATANFRISSVNGNQAISIASSTTGEFTDSVNTDSPSLGQTVNAATTSNLPITYSIFAIVFSATTNTVGRLGSEETTGNFSFASSTQFTALALDGFSVTETAVQTQMVRACTMQNIAVRCITKGRSKADTVQFRKNAANGNSSVSVTGTGSFEDNAGPFETIVANDKVDWAVTTGSGTGSDNFSTLTVEQLSTDSTYHFLAGNRVVGATGQNAGQTSPFPLSCQEDNWVNTSIEASTQVAMQTAGSVSLLDANIVANTVNGTSTFSLRQNGSTTALAASIGASTTGFIQDATHSVTVAAGDELNYQIAAGGSSGAIDFVSWVTLFTVAAPGSPDEDLWIRPAFMLSEPEITVWQ